MILEFDVPLDSLLSGKIALSSIIRDKLAVNHILARPIAHIL